MKRAFEGDDCRAPGRVLGQLDRTLDRFRARIGKVDLVSAAHQSHEPFGQRGLGLVMEQVVAAMGHLVQLRLGRLHNGRVIMPQIIYRNAAAEI